MDKKDKIAILGFGVEGRAVLDYLIAHDFHEITVCDQKVDLEDKMPDGVSVRLGPHYLDNLSDFDVVFRSPGIRYLDSKVQAVKAAGAKITGSTGFFLEHAKCDIVGVTGTKGKGTTCTLIYEMLKKAGKDAYLGGNIGSPAISFLDKTDENSIVVLELSSFQLQDLEISPKYAVLLNTTTDHLDYHIDRDEYLAAKESLLAHQDKDSMAVLNKDYEYISHYESLIQGKKMLVSREEEVKDGAYVMGDEIFYAEGGKADAIINVEDIALIGSHNLENIMPAIVVAKELGVNDDDIVGVIREFKGLPHRLEFVKEVNGVKYYNDSFSTTTETSMAAVDSFDQDTILIAGGHDKGLDYEQWAVKILTKPSLKTVILIGDLAEKMEQAITEAEEKLGDAEGSPTRVLRRPDLEEAVLEAYALADEGGVVVMSPAAASFDQFENYKKRGEAFRAAVKKLH